MLKINVTGDTMIFRKDFDDRPAYSTSLGKKLQDGTYDNAFINVKFKKGVDIANKTKIDITNGWLTFWKNKEDKPMWEIFINEFTSDAPQEIEGFTELDEDSPF